MTHVRANPGADFKNCCIHQGLMDGSERDYFFQRLIASSNQRLERPPRALKDSVRPRRVSAAWARAVSFTVRYPAGTTDSGSSL